MLGFMHSSRKIIKFTIDGRVVTYFDDIWKEGIQVMPSQNPKMRNMIKKMLRNPKELVKQTAYYIIDANSGKNLEEYQACKTEEELADLIRKDCKEKSLTEIK